MAAITRSPRAARANRRFASDADSTKAHHGWFHSCKNGGTLPYKGLLAFDFLTLADSHPRVVAIRHRPSPIYWYNGTDWEPYRPRYAVVLSTDCPDVTRMVDIEVLPSFEVSASTLKYRRISRQFREERRIFRIFTEKSIRAEPRLTNAKIVLSQAGEGIVPEADLRLIEQIAYGTETFTLNQVVATAVLPYRRAYAAVLNLVASGRLSIPLSRVFDGDTPVNARRH